MNDIVEKKARLRATLKRRRDDIGSEQRREYDQAICNSLLQIQEVNEAQNIFCFISHGSEVNTHPLLDHWFIQNKNLSAPKITDTHNMIAVPFDNWSALTPGQLGILTPKGSAEFGENFDLCITPGLGFTVQGKRLGYGRGYYDQWFSSHIVKHKIALAYECQLLDDLPTDDKDIYVDKIITEKRVIEITT